MSTAGHHLFLSFETAGVTISAAEFDDAEFDRDFRYELIHGVVVVSPATSPAERGPNEWLGFRLLTYQQTHPNGYQLDATLPESDVYLGEDRRRADRLIWVGLGRVPEIHETPAIAVEFVSEGKRNFVRDYSDKRKEYADAGIREYWVINRFERTMTVFRDGTVHTIAESGVFQTDLLPGFQLALSELLSEADRWGG